MGVTTMTELKQGVSGKRTFRLSLSTRQMNDWPLTEVSSDLTVEVGSTTFALHKQGVEKSESSYQNQSEVTRTRINIQVLLPHEHRAHTPQHRNPSPRSSSPADDRRRLRQEPGAMHRILQVFPSISNSNLCPASVRVLLPVSEEISLVVRIITAMATNVCEEQLTSGLSKLETNPPVVLLKVEDEYWWGKSLGVLSLDFFRRVLSSLKSKGLCWQCQRMYQNMTHDEK